MMLPIYMPNERRKLMWVLSFLFGLLVGLIVSGLGAALPIGLACHKSTSTVSSSSTVSSNTYQAFQSYSGPGSSQSILQITDHTGALTLNGCFAMCSADATCAYIDYDYGHATSSAAKTILCTLYATDKVNKAIPSATGHTLYSKAAYSSQISG